MYSIKTDTVLQKKMNRKEFLQLLGIGTASVVGLSAILRHAGIGNKLQSNSKTAGYGKSAYGR